ncbi:MAG: hypothetical protein ACKVU4_15320 [Phycisphaerales bacterium]
MNVRRGTGWVVARAAAMVVGFAGAALLGGCVGWTTYPPEAGQKSFADPNDLPNTDVMVEAFNWAVRKYPPAPADPTTGATPPPRSFAVNLPPELKPLIHKRTVGRITGAAPLTEKTKSLPTYHLASMRLRGDEAQVSILCPVGDMTESPSGEPVYQEVRVNLRGGMRAWTVVGHREWTPAPASPTLSYFDEAAAARAEAALGGGR